MQLETQIDSPSAIGAANKMGLGQMRRGTPRIAFRYSVDEGHLRFVTVAGNDNPADLVAKPTDNMTLDKLRGRLRLAQLASHTNGVHLCHRRRRGRGSRER